MLLTLDVGNSQIFGGVYDGEELKTTFRRTSNIRASPTNSERSFAPCCARTASIRTQIDMAAICSVVPECRPLAAQLLPQVFPLRAVPAAAGREDRTEDSLSQSAGGGRRQDRQRHRRAGSGFPAGTC